MDAATYFVTWRLRAGESELSCEERDIVCAALGYFHPDRYRLLAFVVMDDHVHAILTPNPGYPLSRILHSWKSFTSNRIQALRQSGGVLWQDEYFDRIIRDDRELAEKIDYILSNPWQRWPDISSYPWMSHMQPDG